MPLNPNGKIDKAALPFPDTAQASLTVVTSTTTDRANPTEIAMKSIWETILPNAPRPLPTDESFFDLGGHSILATRLVFEIRKVFVVDAPLGLIFERPTISGLVSAVDALRNLDFIGYKESVTAGLLTAESKKLAAPVQYGQDYVNLLDKLQPSYPSIPADYYNHPLTVFLTGATGFLGAFILHHLLSRQERVKKVICLVRSTSVEQGLARLREGSTDRGVWSDDWVTSGRLEIVTGDLGLDLFGLGAQAWTRVSNEADVVLHNGALVSCPRILYLSSKIRLLLGSLGFPIRKTAICERSRYTDRYRSRLNWKTQIHCFRFLDLCHGYPTLRAAFRIIDP